MSGAVTVGLDQATAQAALRGLLLAVLPPGFDVVRAQDNRVGVPPGAGFVVTNAVGRVRLATNVTTYAPATGQRLVTQPTQLDFDVDVYGPGSDVAVQAVTTLLRDGFATDYLAATPVAFLAVTDPMQVPWIDEARRYEDRWHLTVSLQADVVVTVPQDFFDDLTVQIQPPADGLVLLPFPPDPVVEPIE